MQKWEFRLQERFEQDRLRLLDYRQIDIEFKEWLIKLLYEEVKENHERSEYGAHDNSMHDDRICDRERVRTEQDQISDSGFDLTNDKCFDCGEVEDRFQAVIVAAIEEDSPDDIYDNLYDEIAEYKVQRKIGPKKKKHNKRK